MHSGMRGKIDKLGEIGWLWNPSPWELDISVKTRDLQAQYWEVINSLWNPVLLERYLLKPTTVGKTCRHSFKEISSEHTSIRNRWKTLLCEPNTEVHRIRKGPVRVWGWDLAVWVCFEPNGELNNEGNLVENYWFIKGCINTLRHEMQVDQQL